MTDKQAKNGVREIRIKQKYHFDRIVFCREHNMKLQEQLHIEMEKELGDLAIRLEIIFNIGYVSHNG